LIDGVLKIFHETIQVKLKELTIQHASDVTQLVVEESGLLVAIDPTDRGLSDLLVCLVDTNNTSFIFHRSVAKFDDGGNL